MHPQPENSQRFHQYWEPEPETYDQYMRRQTESVQKASRLTRALSIIARSTIGFEFGSGNGSSERYLSTQDSIQAANDQQPNE